MKKIKATFRWDDIVLPSRSMRQLRELAASFSHRRIVYSDWGFESKHTLGKGINALFAGPSGTGKTMASQILAHELDLDLYRIDLADVINKYIGETEKNLDHVFRMTQDGNAILLFDEADALFGKRAEATDACDRYANIEISYLMQRLEEFDGIVIMASNQDSEIDEAFVRRMKFIVEFPVPGAEERTKIWEHVFPDQTPLAADIDFRFLGQQFEMTGSDIRNAALAAAYIAAIEECCIEMRTVILAIAREEEKMGRVPSQSDFRNYYELIRSELK